jgi:hypothetical protein
VLAFFAPSEGIINENLVERFLNEVQVAEAWNNCKFCSTIDYSYSYSFFPLATSRQRYGWRSLTPFIAPSLDLWILHKALKCPVNMIPLPYIYFELL